MTKPQEIVALRRSRQLYRRDDHGNLVAMRPGDLRNNKIYQFREIETSTSSAFEVREIPNRGTRRKKK